jgi:hypothetical protein
MKVLHSHQRPRLEHFKAMEGETVVSIMAIGHKIHIEVWLERGLSRISLVNETVPFSVLVDALRTIPPQPDYGYNRIDKKEPLRILPEP